MQRELTQRDEALNSFERSLEFRSAPIKAHPSVTMDQEQLGKNLAELALKAG